VLFFLFIQWPKKHIPFLAPTLRGTYYSLFFQLIEQTRRAWITDAQTSL
jgi:hypothetical protein